MKTDCSDNDGLRDSEGQDDHDGHKKSSSSSCRRFQDLARLNDEDMKQISALGVTGTQDISFLTLEDLPKGISLLKRKKLIAIGDYLKLGYSIQEETSILIINQVVVAGVPAEVVKPLTDLTNVHGTGTTRGNYVAISLNESSPGHDVVTLVFNGNPQNRKEYGADTDFKGFGIVVLDNEGETPFAKNMRALLRYNGGTLEYEGVKYNIQVEPVEEGKFDLEIFVLILALLVFVDVSYQVSYFV